MSLDASAIDDMMNDILAAAEGIEDDLPDAILEALQIYAAQVAQKAPVDTGYLKRNIKAIVQGNRYGITMPYYGYFQNFGVSGADDNMGLVVPDWIPLRPSNNRDYKFKKRRFGLRPRRFFLTTDQDMTTLVDRIFNIIENQILSDG